MSFVGVSHVCLHSRSRLASRGQVCCRCSQSEGWIGSLSFPRMRQKRRRKRYSMYIPRISGDAFAWYIDGFEWLVVH